MLMYIYLIGLFLTLCYTLYDLYRDWDYVKCYIDSDNTHSDMFDVVATVTCVSVFWFICVPIYIRKKFFT